MLAVISGILLSLSFPAANLEFLAWVAFVPLFYCLRKKSKVQGFLVAYLAGIVFWSLTIYWLVHVTFLGTALLILYLALYWGLFGLFVSAHGRQRWFVVLVPAFWVALEYARSHALTGFPWALLGYSQYLQPRLIQIAALGGAWLVSFVVMLINAVVYAWLCPSDVRISRVRASGIGIAALCMTLGYGMVSMRPAPTGSAVSRFSVCVVPGNIPQELKWQPSARSFIVEKYLALTAEAGRAKPDLIVWPEAALPVIAQEEPEYLARITAETARIGVPLLLGAVSVADGRYFNSALLVSARGKIIQQYHKLHLVPFGEYIPLRSVLPFLETIAPIGDISRGADYTIFEPAFREEKFGVLICFEDVFPGLAREFVRRQARVLINITNDAWYKMTPAAMQHFQASVLRAVENKVWVVRSANTGVSGFIDPAGQIVQTVRDGQGRQIFVDGYATQELGIGPVRPTLYTRYGDWFVGVCCLYIMVALWRGRRRGSAQA